MGNTRKRRLMVWVAGAALMLSVFVGMTGEASADDGGGTMHTNGIIWCRTC
jgi:hypothetical protein